LRLVRESELVGTASNRARCTSEAHDKWRIARRWTTACRVGRHCARNCLSAASERESPADLVGERIDLRSFARRYYALQLPSRDHPRPQPSRRKKPLVSMLLWSAIKFA